MSGREPYQKPEARIIDLGNELDEANRVLDEAEKILRTLRTQHEELGQELAQVASLVAEQHDAIDKARQIHVSVTAALDLIREA